MSTAHNNTELCNWNKIRYTQAAESKMEVFVNVDVHNVAEVTGYTHFPK